MDEVCLSSDPDILSLSRNGDAVALKALLNDTSENLVDINCKGSRKGHRGWTSLHLACYFGHHEVARILLTHGANPNELNNVGETALHRASFIGREDIVTLLINHNADVGVINNNGETAKQMTNKRNIYALLEAAEIVELKQLQVQFLSYARNGSYTQVQDMLKQSPSSIINCKDEFGNTALHLCAMHSYKELAVLLLQNGADTTYKNNRGQTANSLARDDQMKQVLGVKSLREMRTNVQRFEGPLLKRGRWLGWRPMWVVLDRGVISFFRNRADATTGSRRRTFRYLDDAHIKVSDDVSHVWTIHCSNNTSLVLSVEPKQESVIERQKWIQAVMDHIAFSSFFIHSEERTLDSDSEDALPMGDLTSVLQTTRAQQKLFENQKFQDSIQRISDNLRSLSATGRDVISALNQSLNLLSRQEEVQAVQLSQEQERSRILQEALNVLAEEHHDLQTSLQMRQGHVPDDVTDVVGSDAERDEFFDCDATSLSSSYASFMRSQSTPSTEDLVTSQRIAAPEPFSPFGRQAETFYYDVARRCSDGNGT